MVTHLLASSQYGTSPSHSTGNQTADQTGGGNHSHSSARYLTIPHHHTQLVIRQLIKPVKATMATHLLATSQYLTTTLNR
jgi:hypothetical protein